MKLFWQKKPKNYWAFEIKDTAFFAVALSEKNKEYQLENYIHGRFESKNDDEKFLMLTDQLSRSDFKADKIIVGLDYSQVMSRVIDVKANLADEEIVEQVKLSALALLNNGLDDFLIDYEVLTINKDNPALVSIRWVMARSQTVRTILSLLKQVGLTVTIVDVDVFAIESLIRWVAPKLNSGLIYVFLHIGVANLYFNLYGSGEIKFQHYELNVMENYPLNFEKIHNLIARNLQICASVVMGSTISEIILSGDNKHIMNLLEVISERMNIKASILNPFLYIKGGLDIDPVKTGAQPASFAVTCGLGARLLNGY